MISTAELLAAVKVSKGCTSVAALARELNLPEKTVYLWSRGEHLPDDEGAAMLAREAGLDPGEVVASIRSERASEPAMKALWRSIAERLHSGSAAALAVILAVGMGGWPDGRAEASTLGAEAVAVVAAAVELTAYTLARLTTWLRGFSLPASAPMVRACCT